MLRARLLFGPLVAALVAVCAPASAQGAFRPDGRRYSGQTNQTGKEVSIDISRRRTRIAAFHIEWDSACTQMAPFGATTDVRRLLRIGRGGAFKTRGSYSISLPMQGMTANVTATMRGKFVSGDAARGVFSATVALVDDASHLIDQCQTPKISWIALQE